MRRCCGSAVAPLEWVECDGGYECYQLGLRVCEGVRLDWKVRALEQGEAVHRRHWPGGRWNGVAYSLPSWFLLGRWLHAGGAMRAVEDVYRAAQVKPVLPPA